MDTKKFLENYVDFMMPNLGFYEQAIYLFLFRHSRLHGRDEIVQAFKALPDRMKLGRSTGKGVGKNTETTSEATIRKNIDNLVEKGYLKVQTTNRGRKFSVVLPDEISGLCINEVPEEAQINIEEIDFFAPENREFILLREENECFYCKCQLSSDNYVMEHVVSRPKGNNSYKNIVASCIDCNNRKGNQDVDDFARGLYRVKILNQQEVEELFQKLDKLRVGELKPQIAIENKTNS
jgi:hypothetical protein